MTELEGRVPENGLIAVTKRSSQLSSGSHYWHDDDDDDQMRAAELRERAMMIMRILSPHWTV